MKHTREQHSHAAIMAAHLEGGNYYDDMRIDIAESHRRFANLAGSSRRRRGRGGRFGCTLRLLINGVCMRLGIQEFLIVNGLRRKWLDDFRSYWSDILGGRPLPTALDFLTLLHDYRKRQQHTSELEWSDTAQHIDNWQSPREIYATFNSVRKLALRPVLGLELWKRLPRHARVLEYGCSLAPYYHCYREFFAYKSCNFLLAYIPNYPFHYAKYLYRNDPDVQFVTIDAEDFSDPLKEEGNFDVIILTTVFEHLDDPLFVAEYLLERLKPGGLFAFDYIKSHGHGLDHPNALASRGQAIRTILDQTQMVYGEIGSFDKDISFCIVRKENQSGHD